jgi:hypothetical protein
MNFPAPFESPERHSIVTRQHPSSEELKRGKTALQVRHFSALNGDSRTRFVALQTDTSNEARQPSENAVELSKSTANMTEEETRSG